MPDALADITGPRMEKTPSALSSVVPAQEAQDAIRKAFPYEGELRVRDLWSGDGIARYRANWFREADGRTRVVRSLFLCITRTADGLVVQDETALR